MRGVGKAFERCSRAGVASPGKFEASYHPGLDSRSLLIITGSSDDDHARAGTLFERPSRIPTEGKRERAPKARLTPSGGFRMLFICGNGILFKSRIGGWDKISDPTQRPRS